MVTSLFLNHSKMLVDTNPYAQCGVPMTGGLGVR